MSSCRNARSVAQQTPRCGGASTSSLSAMRVGSGSGDLWSAQKRAMRAIHKRWAPRTIRNLPSWMRPWTMLKLLTDRVALSLGSGLNESSNPRHAQTTGNGCGIWNNQAAIINAWSCSEDCFFFVRLVCEVLRWATARADCACQLARAGAIGLHGLAFSDSTPVTDICFCWSHTDRVGIKLQDRIRTWLQFLSLISGPYQVLNSIFTFY